MRISRRSAVSPPDDLGVTHCRVSRRRARLATARPRRGRARCRTSHLRKRVLDRIGIHRSGDASRDRNACCARQASGFSQPRGNRGVGGCRRRRARGKCRLHTVPDLAERRNGCWQAADASRIVESHQTDRRRRSGAPVSLHARLRLAGSIGRALPRHPRRRPSSKRPVRPWPRRSAGLRRADMGLGSLRSRPHAARRRCRPARGCGPASIGTSEWVPQGATCNLSSPRDLGPIPPDSIAAHVLLVTRRPRRSQSRLARTTSISTGLSRARPSVHAELERRCDHNRHSPAVEFSGLEDPLSHGKERLLVELGIE